MKYSKAVESHKNKNIIMYFASRFIRILMGTFWPGCGRFLDRNMQLFNNKKVVLDWPLFIILNKGTLAAGYQNGYSKLRRSEAVYVTVKLRTCTRHRTTRILNSRASQLFLFQQSAASRTASLFEIKIRNCRSSNRIGNTLTAYHFQHVCSVSVPGF